MISWSRSYTTLPCRRPAECAPPCSIETVCCRMELTIFTDTLPPSSLLWLTVSSVAFSECATRSMPPPSLPASPPRISQLFHDSPTSRTGQASRPFSPTSSITLSTLGGASTSRVMLEPDERSTMVEFCT